MKIEQLVEKLKTIGELMIEAGNKLRRQFSNQTTFCYCPKCKHELIGDRKTKGEEVNMTKTVETEPGVWKEEIFHTIYELTCSKCKHESHWLFDTPVPILIDKEGDKNEKDN